ncbi:hypothetical protein SAMN06265348_109281 [Pedobacter westerhofensis]|uniref:Lipoprotein n=1 Tax=Pedobacter westerhofensis TaxID=425512 RepID=A0A521EXM9_9SPHI|nr:hypothetical protein [Pedobacter westerhofensis]SMO88694.1 hypothetical protein SAMN06265348_109281 [Pedobacter westerhofensis]
MKLKVVTLAILFAPLLFSCSKDHDTFNPATGDIDDSFNHSVQSWTAGFSDYPKDKEVPWELKSSHEILPAPLDNTSKGILVSGINHSDDLFMYIKKKVSGLSPNKTYKMKVDVELASNALRSNLGVGGSPGGSVILKAGMTLEEPKKVMNPTGTLYVMNIDKGNQEREGVDAVKMGDIDNGTNKTDYALISRSAEFTGKADSNGEAWVYVGTDSGYEGTTTLYYTKVKASFSAVD